MSRTPETIIDEKAQATQNWINAAGAVVLLLSLASCGNGAGGTGLGFLLFAIALFWIASKIKVKWEKEIEVSKYRKR